MLYLKCAVTCGGYSHLGKPEKVVNSTINFELLVAMVHEKECVLDCCYKAQTGFFPLLMSYSTFSLPTEDSAWLAKYAHMKARTVPIIAP